MNLTLRKEHKEYIKKIMTEPQNITHKDFGHFSGLTAEDRAHIAIIVMETRKRIELIFVTRAMLMLGL